MFDGLEYTHIIDSANEALDDRLTELGFALTTSFLEDAWVDIAIEIHESRMKILERVPDPESNSAQKQIEISYDECMHKFECLSVRCGY